MPTRARSAARSERAAVTPARNRIPATSEPFPAPGTALTRTNAPIIADVTAATGIPTPIARPALAADDREPSAADVRPAPSRASAGRLNRAMTTPATRSGPSVSVATGRATIVATISRPPKIRADARAPRRAARIATRRRPVGSGRQLGSHGPNDQTRSPSIVRA